MGKAILKNLKVEKNVGTNNSGGIGLDGNLDENSPIILQNVTFSGNQSNQYAELAVCVGAFVNVGKFICSDCTFDGMEYTDHQPEAVIGLESGTESSTFKNCTIQGYTGMAVTLYAKAEKLVLENSRIVNNTARNKGGYEAVGGIQFSNAGRLILNKTVVTGNRAEGDENKTLTGGIYVDGAFYFNSGAIYGNTTKNKAYGNDLIFRPESKVIAIAASSMEDDKSDIKFDYYIWKGHSGTGDEKGEIDSDYDEEEKSYTATLNIPRHVAAIRDQKYETLAEAVAAAQPDDIITLIAGEDDEYGSGFTSDPVKIEKSVCIDMNGKTVWASGMAPLFQITSEGMLTLEGTGEIQGDIRNEGKADIAGTVTTRVMTHEGESLTLRGTFQKAEVELAKGKTIQAEPDFKAEKMIIRLDEETLEQLNKLASDSEQADIVLIENCKDEEIASKVSFPGLTSYFVSPVLVNGKLVLRKENYEGIFVDGGKGDDANAGSLAAPVKTVEKALELAKENRAESIYVIGVVEVNVDTEWDGKQQKTTLRRYPSYNGNLIQVSGGKLTLKNLTIDGAAKKIQGKACDSLIRVKDGASLTLSEGAVLQNNDVSGKSGFPTGGAVYNAGTLRIEEGSIIQNCTAMLGGGVYCGIQTGKGSNDGPRAMLIMTGGTIRNNTAKAQPDIDENAKKAVSGGGIMLGYRSTMEMSGGVIQNNTSGYNGGGISLGSGNFAFIYGGDASFIPDVGIVKLIMKGGIIEGNSTGHDGGGIFVQSCCEAEISAGKIEDNTCQGGPDVENGLFGGGGIYVNGGKSPYPNGLLKLTNVLIADNVAEASGGGIAACPTSITKIYLQDGGVIYQNKGESGQDIYIAGYGSGVGPEIYISEYMLGGGLYHWKNGLGEEVAVNQIKFTQMPYLNLHLHTDRKNGEADIEKARGMARVFITGNSSQTNGGGIGSNGDVVIGTNPSEKVDIAVKKVWEDGDNAYHTRPDSVKVWLLRNGEAISFVRVQTEIGSDEWPVVRFQNQPKYDENGDEYKYTIREDSDSLMGIYTGRIEANGENSWKLTNTLDYGNLTVSKTVTGKDGETDREFHFRVTLGKDTITGMFGEMTFKKGIAEFTLKHGQSITAKGLPAGTTYTVEEKEANQNGYTTTASGTTGTIPAKETAKVTFTNKKGEDPTDSTDPGTEPHEESETPKQPESPVQPPSQETPSLAEETDGVAVASNGTGDAANPALWMALMAAAAAGIGSILVSQRRKKQ
ncbi:MAG: Cna B-type domain-containing protein [Eubacteriales bacterium]|nr:Cna B-type domain-containing protein [Eubacteriales bacterium]